MITISGKVLGRKKPLFADWSIPFPPDLRECGDRVTLRDLITRIVKGEVTAFRKRQKERELVRALTAGDIEKGVVRGKVDMGGRKLNQKVDEDGAIGTAHQAFEAKPPRDCPHDLVIRAERRPQQQDGGDAAGQASVSTTLGTPIPQDCFASAYPSASHRKRQFPDCSWPTFRVNE